MNFEVKLTYARTCYDGIVRKVTEAYLINAEAFTDAEFKMGKYAEAYGIYDWSIRSIRIVNYVELFNDEDGDCYFDVSLNIITINERTGREKKCSIKVLVLANDIEHAKAVLSIGMKGSLVDYRIAAIKESKMIDTIGFNSEIKNN